MEQACWSNHYKNLLCAAFFTYIFQYYLHSFSKIHFTTSLILVLQFTIIVFYNIKRSNPFVLNNYYSFSFHFLSRFILKHQSLYTEKFKLFYPKSLQNLEKYFKTQFNPLLGVYQFSQFHPPFRAWIDQGPCVFKGQSSHLKIDQNSWTIRQSCLGAAGKQKVATLGRYSTSSPESKPLVRYTF